MIIIFSAFHKSMMKLYWKSTKLLSLKQLHDMWSSDQNKLSDLHAIIRKQMICHLRSVTSPSNSFSFSSLNIKAFFVYTYNPCHWSCSTKSAPATHDYIPSDVEKLASTSFKSETRSDRVIPYCPFFPLPAFPLAPEFCNAISYSDIDYFDSSQCCQVPTH